MSIIRPSLRNRLRSETRTAHGVADAAFSTLDVSRPSDLGGLLRAHLAVYGGLVAQGQDRGLAGLGASVASLRADLAGLGRDVPPSADLPACDPVAVEYILRGSGMGRAMLHRRWRATSDAQALSAGRFLSSPFDRAGWQSLLARLSRVPGDDTTAERVVRDARCLFNAMVTALAPPHPVASGV